jgi:hypothetical protein
VIVTPEMLQAKEALGSDALYEKSRWSDLDVEEYGQLKAQMTEMYNRADEAERERHAASQQGASSA